MNQSERIKIAVSAALSKGFKKAEIAARCKVSAATVSQWSSGETKTLRAENVFGLADMSGLSARWIALEEGPRESLEGNMELEAPPQPKASSQITNAADVDLDLLQSILDNQEELRDEFQHFMKELKIVRIAVEAASKTK